MPVSIKLSSSAGLLVLEYNSRQNKFQAQHDLNKLKNDGEYYVVRLRDNTLYRGSFKKIGKEKFGTYNLAKFFVIQNNTGYYFIGHNQFLLNDEGKIKLNPVTVKYCSIISLAGTTPGLPVPAIGCYSFTNIDVQFKTFFDDVSPATLDALVESIRRERENLEITDVMNHLFAKGQTPEALQVWKLFREIYQRADRNSNPLVQDKLLQLVQYHQTNNQYAFERELMAPIASSAQLGLMAQPVQKPAAAPVQQKPGELHIFSLRN